MLDVVLKPGRDRSLRRRHPWLLSGAVSRTEGAAEPGALARVVSAGGEPLAFGHYSPLSQIRVRLLGFGKEAPAEELVEERIARAVQRRAVSPLLGDTDAVRLVNGEGDGLPGLAADRYGDVVVVRISSAGMHARRERVVQALREATGAPSGYERADSAAARREGIPQRDGLLWGAEPPEHVVIDERGRRYRVDVRHGQKTGFYLDQRESRHLAERLGSGRRVLDLFAYTGGFAAAAARGGARSVTLVETSVEALALAERNVAENAPGADARFLREDAFRAVRRGGERFDLVVVDPPPLARRKTDAPRAARAYKDVLLHALRRTEDEGYLLAFSCSHYVGPDLFRKIAFGASLDAGRPAVVLEEPGAPPDHPVSLDHPEGAYLSGLLLHVRGS